MDTRPIGVFDSGLGGLTSVKEFKKLLPGENIIYLGDTGRVPYGGRSRETIIDYAREDMDFLLRFNIKAVAVACGTVSSNALEEIKGDYDIPIFGVVNSAARAAVRKTKNKRIGIIATSASIKSGAYARKIKELLPDAEVFSKACPLFVPLVENHRTDPGDIVIYTVAEEYLQELKPRGVDTLILGCTHYPIIAGTIGRIMGEGVTLIDSGAETVRSMAAYLKERDMLSGKASGGECKYYVTDSAEDFSSSAVLFLQSEDAKNAERVSLDDLK